MATVSHSNLGQAVYSQQVISVIAARHTITIIQAHLADVARFMLQDISAGRP